MGRFGIQAMEMTSAEILSALRANQETKPLNKQMKEILEMADFVKFAKVKPGPDDNESAMRNAVTFVEETRPKRCRPKLSRLRLRPMPLPLRTKNQLPPPRPMKNRLRATGKNMDPLTRNRYELCTPVIPVALLAAYPGRGVVCL